MSEALERIKGHFNPKDIANKELFEEDFNTIEKKLKEAETYKEILNDYGLTLANFREACLLFAQWKNAGLCWADYEKQKKALKIIVKKANIRLVIMNGRYYFKTTNNLYEISLEKYKILLETIYD